MHVTAHYTKQLQAYMLHLEEVCLNELYSWVLFQNAQGLLFLNLSLSYTVLIIVTKGHITLMILCSIVLCTGVSFDDFPLSLNVVHTVQVLYTSATEFFTEQAKYNNKMLLRYLNTTISCHRKQWKPIHSVIVPQETLVFQYRLNQPLFMPIKNKLIVH